MFVFCFSWYKVETKKKYCDFTLFNYFYVFFDKHHCSGRGDPRGALEPAAPSRETILYILHIFLVVELCEKYYLN